MIMLIEEKRGHYLIASRTAWYIFIFRVSRPAKALLGGPERPSSIQRSPGVRNAESRVLRK